MVLELLTRPVDSPFSAHNAQKPWWDEPHLTQREAWVQKGQWPPRFITPVSGTGSTGSPEHSKSPEMPGRGHVPVWSLMAPGSWMRMGAGMVREETSQGSADFSGIMRV